MEKFNLKKLNDVDIKDEYQIKISNRFAALENLDVMWTSTGPESKS
jgi:hypothetical protein